MKAAALTCLLFLLAAATASAATWHIRPDGTGDAPTIQAGIDSAAAGDVVALLDGEFTGPGNRDIVLGEWTIVVRSAGGDPAACIVDCEGSASDPHRGFLFPAGSAPTTRLEGITVRNGHVVGDYPEGMGGGILCEGASPVLQNLRILSNRAHNGGGVSCRHGSSPEIRDCVFQGNRAIVEYDGDGGGLHCYDSSSPLVSGCVFFDNRCDSQGGAVFCYDHSDPMIQGCTFVGNGAVHPAYGRGGAISLYVVSSPRIDRCIVAFTIAGGAFYCYGSSCVPVISCSDVFANTGGDGLCGVDAGGNLSADPLFCGETTGDFRIRSDSPCAPADSGGCGLIGALPVGCGPVALTAESWAGVKGGYR